MEWNCEKCGLVVSGEDVRLTPIGHGLPGISEIGFLCRGCHTEICPECESAFMEQERPEWQWACENCGVKCPADMMLFFKGHGTIQIAENE